MPCKRHILLAGVAAGLLWFGCAIDVAVAADPPAPVGAKAAPAAEPLFAEVNGRAVSAREYEQAVYAMQRQKYYHGKIPDAEVQTLYRAAADQLINRLLLLEEAKARNIVADETAVAQQLEDYEKRYAASPSWKKNREAMLPGLTGKLREQNLLARIEADARRQPTPTAEEVRTYYDTHPDYFTEPEKIRVSMILLSVDPSSTTAVWQKAVEEAAAIRRRLVEGADFAEQARLHSGDSSAAQGGDMGYLHRGMLPEPLHAQLDTMQVGQISEPIRILEGVSLFRLDERQTAKKRAFDDVASRAKELAVRDRGEKAWTDFLAGLRAKAQIRIDTQRYPLLKTEDAKTEDAKAAGTKTEGVSGR